MAKFTVKVRLERVQIRYVDIEIDKENLKDALEEIGYLSVDGPGNLVGDPSAWGEEEYDSYIESIDDEEGHTWGDVRDVKEAFGVND